MANEWLNKHEYPFGARYFTAGNHKMHYIDEGEGDTVLFVHGTPSWSFDFRNIIKKLRQTFRCIAIEHIGFGLSDKPRHYDYSTKNHSKTLERFVLEKKLKNITLVVHDFGGPIGLHFAQQHPQLVSKIVVLNSWLWSSSNDPEFVRFSKILKSPLLPLLYRYLNFSPRFILPKSFGDHKPPASLLGQYTRPFPGPAQRNGPLAFAMSLLNDQDWFEELWNNRHAIAQKPTLLVWGMKDPVIKPSYLEKFASGFANSMIAKLPGCGHFPQEEEPEAVTAAMLAFLGRY